jgi:PAS domain S-box-containing protein
VDTGWGARIPRSDAQEERGERLQVPLTDMGVGSGGTTAPPATGWGLLCSVDSRGYFTSLGEGWEQALGWTREELMSRPFADFVHPTERAETLAALSNAWHGDPASAVLETRFRARGGTWQRVRWSPSPDRAGLVAAAPAPSSDPPGMGHSVIVGWALRAALVLAVACSLVVLGLFFPRTGSDRAGVAPTTLAEQLPMGLHGPVDGFGPVWPTWHGGNPPPGVVGFPIAAPEARSDRDSR